MKNVKRNNSQKIGEKAEALLESRLSEYCSVNKMHKDFGIDFSCSLTLNEVYSGKEFYAQCKGAEKVDENTDYISLQLKTSTVRLWFKNRYLTFLFYVDLHNEFIYWVDPFDQLFQKIKDISDNQHSIVIKVPKSNLLNRKEKELPSSFFESMRRFDKYLFDGTLVGINKDIDTFSENDYFTEDMAINENENSIEIKLRNVRLQSFYPEQRDTHTEGSCLIQFARHLKKAENDMTFTHKQLLDLFYFGRGYDAKLGMRKYVGLLLDDFGQYFMDLGNSRIYLYPHEVDDLCQVIDVFIEKYVSKITNFIKKIGANDFEPYRNQYTSFKLMEVEIELWEQITDYVQCHQTDSGKYADGFIFTTLSNANQIGLNDSQGYQLFNVYGHFVQSKYNSKHLVVDIVWEYLDDSSYYRKSDHPFTVAETYSYFIEDLLSKFLFKQIVTHKKKFWFEREKIVCKNLSKKEVELNFPKTSYRLKTNVESSSELANTCYQLTYFFKDKKYYFICHNSINNTIIYFEKCFISSLSHYSDYSKTWYEREKKNIDSITEQIKSNEENNEPTRGYLYASIFKFLESVVCEFKESFNRTTIQQHDLLQDIYEPIHDFNEEKFVKLLIN